MVALKCKMCGGDLSLTEGSTVCECEFCGTLQTIPNLDNEKKANLFSRANRLRFNNEFDKAAGVYESIISDFQEEAEAYWGLVLCKYGIEYVDDPLTGKKVPTCHRSSFESIFDDNNYELVMEYADAISKRVYREEAKQIEELRKGIIEVSSNEQPYDIFICYKETDENGDRTLDSVLAQDIYNALTEKGYRVFFSRISLEDKLGVEYEPYIFAALHSAKVMLAVGTQYEYYDAVWVKNEWSRYLKLIASGEKKTLIPVYKNLDAYDMPKEFARLQAQDMGKVGAMQDLLRGIEKIVGGSKQKQEPKAESALSVLNAQTQALLKRGNMSLEDGDYTRASEFFEQVLNNDAECAQAYWGKTLCSRCVNSAEKLARQLVAGLAQKKTVTIPLDIVKAARSADEADELLKDFHDWELNDLFKKMVAPQPISYQSAKDSLNEAKQKYNTVESLLHLINDHDCSRAWKYKDAYVETKMQSVLDDLQLFLSNSIQDEERNEEAQLAAAEESFEGLKKEINKRLAGVADKYRARKNEYEEKKQNAERQAEINWQNAVNSFEKDYETRVSAWEKEKKDYHDNYDSAVARQNDLKTKIAALEKEKNALTGLFSGRKRKELENNIAALRQNLSAVTVPKDPGEKPVKGNAPDRKDYETALAKKDIDTKKLVIIALDPERVINDLLKDFGHYPFYADGTAMPIKWRILEVRGTAALIISEMGIDTKEYNEKYESTTWKHCALRRWLNSDFIERTFSAEEQKLIMETTVSADKNPSYDTDPGKDTRDKVFLFSIPEAKRYFKTDIDRTARPTGYAKKNNAFVAAGNCWWWLRSPGNNAGRAAFINPDGLVYERGYDVKDGNRAVRPALWIDVSDL